MCGSRRPRSHRNREVIRIDPVCYPLFVPIHHEVIAFVTSGGGEIGDVRTSAWFSDEGLGVFHEDFTDESAMNPDRLALAAKVTCVPSEKCDSIFPNQFPAIVTATLTDGSSHVAEVLSNRGGPERPLTDAELEIKFTKNCERTIAKSHADQIRAAVQGLASGDTTIQKLGELLKGDQQ